MKLLAEATTSELVAEIHRRMQEGIVVGSFMVDGGESMTLIAPKKGSDALRLLGFIELAKLKVAGAALDRPSLSDDELQSRGIDPLPEDDS